MSWTLRCLRKTCNKVFNGSTPDSRCPKCKGRRTRWIPAGIAVVSKATGIDKTARSLASDYSMGDFASPEAGLAARRVATPSRTFNYEPIPGWKVPVPIGDGGAPMAACAPTGQTVTIRPQDGTVGRVKLPMPKPKIEGSYRPQVGAK